MNKFAVTLVGGLTAFSQSAIAANRPSPGPATYLQAFNKTCRQAFPLFDQIAAKAVADGWQESSIRRIDGVADVISANLPRVFHKDGLMLFLTRTDTGPYDAVCQITGSDNTRLSGEDVEAVVSNSLHAGSPVRVQDAERDTATWQVAPRTTVEAGVSIYRRKTRTITIAVRQDR
jgi:hypothetical protein